MKTISGITAAITAALAAASCSTYNYMTTEIGRDLSAERTVYAQADSSYLAGDRTGNPFFFDTGNGWETGLVQKTFTMDFHDGEGTMNVYAVKHLRNLGKSGFVPADPDSEGNPILYPEEKAEKRFRWFFTEYEYSAVYHGMTGLPVPLDEYMDRESQEIFLRGADIPADWNGIETYSMLDDINTKFFKWYRRCTFAVSHDIIYNMCSDNMKGIMDRYSEEYFSSSGKDDDEIYPEDLCTGLDRLAGTSCFTELYSSAGDRADSLYSEKEGMLVYFGLSLLSEVRMPGKVIRTDAETFKDGAPLWKIDCYRLLYGDLTLNAVSRKLNLWAFIVTFAVLAAGIYILIRRI